MVTFACVCVGTKYRDDYVLRLMHGIERFCPGNHKFICYTDRSIPGVTCETVAPGLPGWWSKLFLFSLGKPLIYFDLDTLIVGDLTRLLEWDGFGILKDPWAQGYGSGIMKLTGEEGHVWHKFQPGIVSMMRGDQDWLNVVMPGARTFPSDWFPSFKADKCIAAPPQGAMAVNFHGLPKMHQISSGWVPEYWK